MNSTVMDISLSGIANRTTLTYTEHPLFLWKFANNNKYCLYVIMWTRYLWIVPKGDTNQRYLFKKIQQTLFIFILPPFSVGQCLKLVEA